MANTIAGVNLAAIAEESLPHLTTCFAPLKGIITDFSAEIKDKGESVTTRYPTKPTAADLSAGYNATDVVMTAVTVSLDTFFGFVYAFTDVERSKSSIMLQDLFINPAVECLGDKVFGDLWNLVTIANFANATIISAPNFDRTDLADLSANLTQTLKAPKQGRTLWSAPSYHAGLVKSLFAAEFPGQSEDKAEGSVPRTCKFDAYESDLMDNNAQNLGAFAFHRSALCMAGRSVDATGAREAGVEVEDVQVPGLNIPVQFRRWYEPTQGKLYVSVGLLYGVKKGTAMGWRITSA